MPRDANGNYTLPSGNPVVPGTPITTSWANPTLLDLANEMTNSLSRDGEGGMLVPFKFTDGSVGTPSITFTNDTQTGLYRAGTNDMRQGVAGVDRMRWTSTRVQVWDLISLTWKDVATGGDLSQYLPLVGGTVTGQVKGITPVDPEDFVRKDYADALQSGLVSFNTRTTPDVIPTAGDYDAVQVDYANGLTPLWTATEVQAALESAYSDIQFLSGATTLRGVWDANLNLPDLIAEVKVAGDYWVVSVSGNAVLPLYPGAPAFQLPYAISDRILWLDDGAGTDGFAQLRPEVEDYLLLTGGTMIGQIVGINPISSGDLTRKDYVDSEIANAFSVIDYPVDSVFGRIGTIVAASADYSPFYLGLGGGTVTGSIKGVAAIVDADLTRKDYVDNTTAAKIHTHVITDVTDLTAALDAKYDKTDFIDVSTGGADANLPIKTNGNGQLDSSFLAFEGLVYIDTFTPVVGSSTTEYPDVTGIGFGSFWAVDILEGDTFTWTVGDLWVKGKTAERGDFMLWGAGATGTGEWGLITAAIDGDIYYLLDGTVAITADFAGGGFKITNIADGVALTDAATVGQLNTGSFLPLTGGTVTGQIKGITPLAIEDLTRKDYVDGQIASSIGAIDYPVDSVFGRLGVVVADASDYATFYLSLVGGTVTGQVKGISPVDPADFTRKDYVDDAVAGINPPVASVFGRVDAVVATLGDYTASLVSFDGALTPTWIATEVQSALEEAYAEIQFLSGSIVLRGVWDALLNQPDLVAESKVNGNYWIVSVTGTTPLPNYPDGLTPITDWQVSDRVLYIDDGIDTGFSQLRPDDSQYLLKSGGVMTGQIKGLTPQSPEDLTRRDYVDGQIATRATTAQGALADTATQPLDPISTLTNDVGYITSTSVPIQTVFGRVGAVVASVTDYTPEFIGAATASQGDKADAALQPLDNVSELVNDAGYITSAPAAPVTSVFTRTGAVTAVISDYAIYYLGLAGGTVTGQIVGIAPVAAGDLTRKDYVDNKVSAIDFPVDTVFGRTGAVVSTAGDYIADYITYSQAIAVSWGATVQAALDDAYLNIQFLAGAVVLRGPWDANLNAPDLTTISKVSGNYWICNVSGATALPNFPDGLAPISDWLAQDRVLYVDNVDGVGFVKLRPDVSEYVLRTGSTMTGQLVTIAPVAAGDAANKGYVDTQIATRATTAQGALADSATQPGDPVSSLANDAGYITSFAVASVFGRTGAVVALAADYTPAFIGAATAAQGATADTATQPGDPVSSLANDAGYITSAPASPVSSVFGRTGAVVALATDYTPAFIGAATTAQGTLADTATQPADPVSSLTNDAGYITTAEIPPTTPIVEGINYIKIGGVAFQWGIAILSNNATVTTVTFDTPMPSGNYAIGFDYAQPGMIGANAGVSWIQLQTKTATSFSFNNASGNNIDFSWQVIGS